jgi:hypothetical protein
MDLAYTKFYQLGNDGDLVFEKDLDQLAEHLGRPHPEFFGMQVNDQPGGELQWVVVTDMRGKMEPPTSEGIRFTTRENNWLDGLARAMQEALARLCGQHVNQIKGTRFFYYARHDSQGMPLTPPMHPELRHHVDHLDYMLTETRKELDNARAYANHRHLIQAEKDSTFTILVRERKSLRRQRDQRDQTIVRLRQKIASLKETIHDQELLLEEMDEEGEDIGGDDTAYLSDDDDYLEDRAADDRTDEEDYAFIDDEPIVEKEDEATVIHVE